jgi:hypothetical protein
LVPEFFAALIPGERPAEKFPFLGTGKSIMRRVASGTRCPAITCSTNTWTPGFGLPVSAKDKKEPCFPSIRKGNNLTGNHDAERCSLHDKAPRERCRTALLHLLPFISSHRNYQYLQNGGTLERAQQIEAHQSPRTTKLYDRTSDEISLDDGRTNKILR